MIDQMMIALTGCVAVFLTQQNNVKWKKYAPILGLVGQPFWFYTTYANEQWGIFILSFFYTYSWGLGVYNSWVR